MPTAANGTELPDLCDLLAGVDLSGAFVAEPDRRGVCGKCGRTRAVSNQSRGCWVCGTCAHREARRVNCKEMWGHGRRGY